MVVFVDNGDAEYAAELIRDHFDGIELEAKRIVAIFLDRFPDHSAPREGYREIIAFLTQRLPQMFELHPHSRYNRDDARRAGAVLAACAAVPDAIERVGGKASADQFDLLNKFAPLRGDLGGLDFVIHRLDQAARSRPA